MGYETYLVEIHVRDNKERFICDLKTSNFTITERDQNLYLEKKYSSGFVEICVTDRSITFRYAKPNLTESLCEFLKELQMISKKYEIALYDVHNKKEYNAENFLEISNTFESTRKEFAKYFSVDTFPIKSEDVFKKKL